MNFERNHHRQKQNIQIVEKKKLCCEQQATIYSNLLTIINDFKSLDINNIEHYNTILTQSNNLYQLLNNNTNIQNNTNIILELESIINIIENIKDVSLKKKKALLNTINTLKEERKLCLSKYKDSISSLDNKLSLEKTIKEKELKRISNKHLQHINKYKSELSDIEAEYIILSDEKYKKETEKLELEQELEKYNNVKKLFRNTIINQINLHNTKKDTLRNSIIDSKKIYNNNINDIKKLQTYLKEYPLYKLNINLEYYKQLYVVYLIINDIITLIKPLYNDIKATDNIEYVNMINNLGKLLCNKDYKNIFNNLNTEYDYNKISNIKDNVNYIINIFSNIDINIFNTVSNLSDVTKYKCLLDSNKDYTIFTENIEYINELLILLEEKCNMLFKFDYNKKVEDLMAERLKKQKTLNSLLSNNRILSSRINNNNISIKELQFSKTFFVSDKEKIKALKQQLNTIISDITIYNNKTKQLTDKITNIQLLIESNIYNETLNNDFIRCNLRYKKIYDRTTIQKILLEEEYNNKLQTITENINNTQANLNNCIINEHILTYYNNLYNIKLELQNIGA